MRKHVILIFLFLFCDTSNAGGIKVVDEFKCYSEASLLSDDFLITAVVNAEKQKELVTKRLLSSYSLPAQNIIKVISGELHIGSVIYNAAYSVFESDKRWAFGPAQDDSPDYFRYAFVIKPDGVGKLYDFNQAGEDGMATPDKYYECVNMTGDKR